MAPGTLLQGAWRKRKMCENVSMKRQFRVEKTDELILSLPIFYPKTHPRPRVVGESGTADPCGHVLPLTFTSPCKHPQLLAKRLTHTFGSYG